MRLFKYIYIKYELFVCLVLLFLNDIYLSIMKIAFDADMALNKTIHHPH